MARPERFELEPFWRRLSRQAKSLPRSEANGEGSLTPDSGSWLLRTMARPERFELEPFWRRLSRQAKS